MYKLIYDLYFTLKRVQKRNKENGRKTPVVIQKIINRIEWFYNVCVSDWLIKYPSQKYGLNRIHREQKIIVSLTSYPKRINTVSVTIETLLRQSVKPDKLILWLANTQFKDISVLPERLLALQKRGLTIRFCDDLRSHKKYFFVMQEYPDDLIILADDDMFYPKDTVKKLLKMHKKYPNDICTMSAQRMFPSFASAPSQWRNPYLKEKYEHSNKVQVFTGSGSLYPPHSLDQAVFDAHLVKKLCPYADDLWLTYMAYKKNTRITVEYPWRAFPLTIYGTSEESLWYINAAEGQNDKQWKALLEYYKERKE